LRKDAAAPVRSGLLLYVCATLGIAACTSASADEGHHRWVRVVRDANYDIAIDTAQVKRRIDWWEHERLQTYEVWYRTDHAAPRLHEGKEFNREVVQSIVYCDSLWFKVLSVDMSMNGGRPISIQRTEKNDLEDQRWRRVERGTAEEIAGQAACHFASKRFPKRGRR
jgi:hypothetical protein